ncbi:DUF1501 domain-containing protein [Pseudaestuariivita atlantica]|uniref:Twin-arginine translocation pathway signal n=1 Tax=Pseudaestuariivita atlantica TaxID=1317121 RepID=A0A0L1JPF6_9RHOB|nr:DUF1501 domain-containing protein [Pseudaestuariivita atlantica]KNG93611.1 twin-arginine translocation pathway signal [Pseudaestuariivita atlantica]
MTDFTRRRFLTRSLALGCSAAASPLMTPVSLAAAPFDNRLVVIILRGGMDGLGVVQPYGDPGYEALRGAPVLSGDDALMDLDGFYGLNPALAPLYPMWQAGELSFAHAVSTPYRGKRSHFDGQDILEAGSPDADGVTARDGWLNRMLQTVPGITAETAYAIGHGESYLLRGAAPVSNWSPEVDVTISPQGLLLADLVMHDDPVFRDALAQAFELADSDGTEVAGMDATEPTMGGAVRSMAEARGNASHTRIAQFAAERLREDSRIAAFSINGWDTHLGQSRMLPRALTRLSDTLITLRDTLKGDWSKTTVIAMTEFGRTARFNGTDGTDHGTGGTMLMAGGALRRQQVVADWPGLGEADLYGRRDLMPTRDVRAHAAWVMRGMFGLDRSTLETSIFPGLDMGADPNLIA